MRNFAYFVKIIRRNFSQNYVGFAKGKNVVKFRVSHFRAHSLCYLLRASRWSTSWLSTSRWASRAESTSRFCALPTTKIIYVTSTLVIRLYTLKKVPDRLYFELVYYAKIRSPSRGKSNVSADNYKKRKKSFTSLTGKGIKLFSLDAKHK